MFREFKRLDHYDRGYAEEYAPPRRARALLPQWLRGPLTGAVAAVVFGGTFGLLDPTVARENALLENAQVALIAFAVLLHARKGLFAGAESAAGLGRGLLALFCASVIVREIDIDRIGATAVWTPIEIGVRSAIALAWVVLLGFAARQWRRLLRLKVILSQTSLLTAVAISLYAIGWGFEQFGALAPATALFWEELSQLCGAVFFLAGSMRDLGLSEQWLRRERVANFRAGPSLRKRTSGLVRRIRK